MSVQENHPPDAAPEAPDEITERDREPGNLYVRAGYLRGLASSDRVDDDARLFLLRASRSLRAFAELLEGKT